MNLNDVPEVIRATGFKSSFLSAKRKIDANFVAESLVLVWRASSLLRVKEMRMATSSAVYRSQQPVSTISPQSDLKILVIEHDSKLLSYIRRVIENRGHDVMGCRNLPDALTRINGHGKPDVVIFDENVPSDDESVSLRDV